MNKYKCKLCKKIVERDSEKAWIKSVCDETGITTRLIKMPKLLTQITFENSFSTLIVRCPDEDDEFSIIIQTGLRETVYPLSLEEANSIGKYLYEHIKNAKESNQ